ncbi:hypothetical protein CAOG_08490 [Capsaspora owczarzaki ATCC 30864]|uniref:Importin N-terminal domain-containing protein n=1 Tax=Capsaspora owczarzaki (strain ATCC 30864) TaxID=595528 RepID=A0A0D2VIK2_CAPO3|nr:hypothetical protein CAOG_08490 [Capsaspora owczarzaki ATCC 30864]KJE89817.1 hypothetical protein CAOG_008490 [Capsaspora owczarzaki ATCC 30864]|eukprot:XP_011270072.1 hypothetical protein CAOG_08490 [Capsaspora owczarzaki ATCC 30864]
MSLADIVAQALQMILQRETVAEGTQVLQQNESQPGFCPTLLQIAATQYDAAPGIAQAAAIQLKNCIRKNWDVQVETVSLIADADREVIKTSLLNAAMATPSRVQAQLVEAIGLVAWVDFPDNWPQLLPAVVELLNQSEDIVVLSMLITLVDRLCEHYKSELACPELSQEFKYVVDHMAQPLLTLATRIHVAATNSIAAGASRAALLPIITLLRDISRVWYVLNYLDLPEYFEDHMSEWMTLFRDQLAFNTQVYGSDDEDEASPLEELKAQIFTNVTHYVKNGEESFTPLAPTFITATWEVLSTLTPELKNDELVSQGIAFFKNVVGVPSLTAEFQPILAQVCEHIIIPSMRLRELDIEKFQHEPLEFILHDFEGSDAASPRRSASELLRVVVTAYGETVHTYMMQFISQMINSYASNPAQNWLNKDAAVYAYLSISVQGSTVDHGATIVSPLSDVPSFFAQHVLPDLTTAGVHPVLVANALKFVVSFRKQLDSMVREIVPTILVLIKNESVVVYSYAAVCFERILFSGVLHREALQPHLQSALQNIFEMLATESGSTSEFLMRALMRVIHIAKDDLLSSMVIIVSRLGEMIVAISKSVNRPLFAHYLFESLAAAIRNTCGPDPNNVRAFADVVFPPFREVLGNFVEDIIPYVFQILALLLDLHPQPISDAFIELLPGIVAPPLWENQGTLHCNIPAVNRCLVGFISKCPDRVSEQIMPVLGVFQRLIASKSFDTEGFRLLSAVIEFLPTSVWLPSLTQIYSLLFERLMRSKTASFVREFLVFNSLLIGLHGTETFVSTVSAIQDNLVGMVVTSLYIPESNNVQGQIERKTVAFGLAKLLSEFAPLVSEPESWVAAMKTLLELYGADAGVNRNEKAPEEMELVTEYHAQYSKLSFASLAQRDPLAQHDAGAVIRSFLQSRVDLHPHRDYEENHYSQRYETTYVEVSFIKQAFSNLVSFLEHYGYFVVLAGFLAYFAFRAAQRFMAERQVTHVQQVIDVDKFHEARKRQQEQHQAITAAKQLELAKRQEEVRAKKLATTASRGSEGQETRRRGSQTTSRRSRRLLLGFHKAVPLEAQVSCRRSE